MKSPNVL